MNLEDAFKKVSDLVADFDKHKGFYLTQEYQEQEARRDFIDKFWIALGWDVNHESQKNPYEQEVKVERKDHAVSQRKADYAFYVDSTNAARRELKAQLMKQNRASPKKK